MRHKRQYAGLIVLAVIFLIAFQPRAYAYLDSGSAGFFIQMLIASLVGFSFALKAYWKRIKDFFNRGKKPQAKS